MIEKDKFLAVLNKELVVALGCTEPVAIAAAAALARHYVGDENILSITVSTSTNVLKNAMSVKIPGTNLSGINLAAALGTFAIHTNKKLEILDNLTNDNIKKAVTMVDKGIVKIKHLDSDKKLYIEVFIETEHYNSKVIIEDSHTNVVSVQVNGKPIDEYPNHCNESKKPLKNDGMDFLDLDSIWEFTRTVDIDELDLIRKTIHMNTEIALEGLNGSYGLNVGKRIRSNMGKGIMCDDVSTYAMALTAAGSDARMSGSKLPVMSNSGSGNQGISATMPIVAFAEKLGSSEDELIRAVALSNLVTIYVKSKFGRLSAICGATISATGVCCGIIPLMGGGITEVKAAVQNIAGNITGMLCDGAKSSCALKVSTCTSAAVQAALIAMDGVSVPPTDGIIEENPEDTIDNICRLGNYGLIEADKIILEVMLNKSCLNSNPALTRKSGQIDID